MQLPSALLVPMTTDTNAVLGPDNTQTGSEEPAGLVFDDLLQLPPPELPVAPAAGDATQRVVGMLLPLAGNTLPVLDPDAGPPAASEEQQLQPLAASPANVDTVSVGQNSGIIEQLTLAAGLSGTLDSRNEGLPAALPVNATVVRLDGTPDSHKIHQALPVPAKPVRPVPAADSALPDLLRNAADTRERAPMLVDNKRALATQVPVSASVVAARLQQDSQNIALTARPRAALLTEPQVSSVRTSPLPVPETGSPLSGQQDSLNSQSLPLVQELANRRSTDGEAAKRSPPPQFAIEGGQEIRASRANRVLQDSIALQMQTETPVPKPATSVPLPAVHSSFVSLPVSSIQATAPLSAAVSLSSIETPVLDPAWAAAVNDRVVWLAGRGIQSAEIRLHPVELGPLQVRVAVNDDSVTLAFIASHAATRDALEIALPRLKDMLAENGMSLAEASVTDQEVADQRDDDAHSGPTGNDPATEESAQAVSSLSPGKPTTRGKAGLVDTYV